MREETILPKVQKLSLNALPNCEDGVTGVGWILYYAFHSFSFQTSSFEATSKERV